MPPIIFLVRRSDAAYALCMDTLIKASELLSQKGTQVYAVDQHATVADAVAEMNRNKVGSILIMADGQIAGILTERDILTRVVPENVNPNDTEVSAVMTRNPVTIDGDKNIDEIMRVMTDKRVRHIPVLDGTHVLGLVSIGDITRHLMSEREQEAANLRHYIAGDYPG